MNMVEKVTLRRMSYLIMFYTLINLLVVVYYFETCHSSSPVARNQRFQYETVKTLGNNGTRLPRNSKTDSGFSNVKETKPNGLWEKNDSKSNIGSPKNDSKSNGWSLSKTKSNAKSLEDGVKPGRNNSPVLLTRKEEIDNSSGNTSVSQDTYAKPDFQPLHNNTIFVYSAYFHVPNRSPGVTVVTIVKRKAVPSLGTIPVTCVYSDSGHRDVERVTVPAKLAVLPDHHGHTFSAALVTCSLPKGRKLVSSPSLTVSLSTPSDPSLTNSVPVQRPPPRQYKFLICFSPLHHGFGNVVQIVENLELAQELGAEHAVVYNTNISLEVDRVLQYYASKGFLEIKSWKNPPEPVHYKGQIAAINDCLFYNSDRTDFIVYMDFDEMIVPRVHKSWSSLFQTLFSENSSSSFVRQNKTLRMTKDFVTRILNNSVQPNSHKTAFPGNIGAVSFRSSVFLWDKLTNLTQEEAKFANHYHVPFLLKQRRIKQMWVSRAKNIVNPRTVNTMGIHWVASFLGERKSLFVHEDIALLHHYRWWSEAPSVKDTNMLRFAPVLVRRMKKTFEDLKLYKI